MVQARASSRLAACPLAPGSYNRRVSTQAEQPLRNTADKQAVRRRRYWLAASTYLLLLVPLAAAHAVGLMRTGAALGIAGAILVVNAALFVLFYSGLNLRFRDPSLTFAQTFCGITLLMVALYHAEAERGVALGLCFLIFLFGLFRLSRREFVVLTLYALAAYATVIGFALAWRPRTIGSLAYEAFNWLLLAVSLPWFAVVAGKIRDISERLRARNVALHEAVAQIQAMATRDDVTGLYNRAFFVESLVHALAQAERTGRRLGLLFIDVDRFKLVNDTLGHAVGDRVLHELGIRIAACVRASDIVARLGGDEFVVLVEGLPEGEALQDMGEKIVRAACQPVRIDGRELAVSVSVGITVAPEDGRDAQTLMRHADMAMYRAKALGRNGYVLYVDEPAPAELSAL